MKIVLAPNQVLKERCAAFDFAEPKRDPVLFADLLHRTRIHAGGIGLAAPQVGILERVFVVGGRGASMTCFNPEILEHGGGIERIEEGCLSYPGKYLVVPRHRRIHVRFQDAQGLKHELHLQDIMARCFQHELDHLDGVTFDTRAGTLAEALRMKKVAQREGRL